MKLILFICVSLILEFFSSPLRAKESIDEKQIVSGKFQFDSQSGYIFLGGQFRQVGYFLRVPEQSDVEDYAKRWEEGFVKAKVNYAKLAENWKLYQKNLDRREIKPYTKIPEPTRENFTIGDINTEGSVKFGPQFVFNKNESIPYFGYMIKLKPGKYIYYGPILYSEQTGFLGTCYCMGSVRFDVNPGVITDLGNFLAVAYAMQQIGLTPNYDKKIGLKLPDLAGYKIIAKSAVQYGLPTSLKSYPYARADFYAAGRMGNYYGLTVSRMPEIDGVLAYQRDKAINVKKQLPK